MSNYKEIAKSYLLMIEEKAKYPHMMYHPESGEEVEVKTPEEHDKYAEKGYTHEKPDLEEAKEHPAYKELMSLAKELDGRDTRAIQVIAGKISNFTATGNRSNIVDLAKAFKALDSYPRDGVIEILQKHDKSLLKSILAKAGMNESTKAYAAALEKIANDKKLKSISKADRETLAKLADLMKNANEAVVEEEITKEDVEQIDEAKGTDVKKFVKNMRVAKTSNPDMKGTVVKGGDNLKKGVEVEWDSGKTTVASGKYLMSIKKEEVELDESVGLQVVNQVANSNLAASLAQTASGGAPLTLQAALAILGVAAASGTALITAFDHYALDGSIRKNVLGWFKDKLKPSDKKIIQKIVSLAKSDKELNDIIRDGTHQKGFKNGMRPKFIARLEELLDPKEYKYIQQMANSISKDAQQVIRKEVSKQKNESVELGEAKEHPAYKDLMKLAKELDGRDTRAIQVMAGKISNFTATGNPAIIADLGKAFKALDSYPRDGVIEILQKHDKSLLKSIAAKAGMKIKEEVELGEGTKEMLAKYHKYKDKQMSPAAAQQFKQMVRKLKAAGVSLKEEVELGEDKERYQKFFNAALKKFGINSPADLTGDKKKEFFDYVDKNYKADKESD